MFFEYVVFNATRNTCYLYAFATRVLFQPNNSFLQFDLQERSKWLFHNKLCYGCLSAISVNQNARNCKNRKECKVCKKKQPTFLHGYKAEKNKVDNREIATTEKLIKWKYMDKLKPIMSVDDNKEVSLLIGANCVLALEPRVVISS